MKEAPFPKPYLLGVAPLQAFVFFWPPAYVFES
jgi:hypothetical protein